MKKLARYLVESELNEEIDLVTEDAALDFVEQFVGRFYFKKNWARIGDKLEKVTAWLATKPEYAEADPAAIVKYIDRQAELDVRWAR